MLKCYFSFILCTFRFSGYIHFVFPDINGLNFSEYVAILSGNTDLLEKAKLEKKITALESERKSFAKERDEAKFRLNTIDKSIDFHTRQTNEAKADMEQFNRLARKDSDGNLLNDLKLNGIESQDIKVLAAKLQDISNKAISITVYKVNT